MATLKPTVAMVNYLLNVAGVTGVASTRVYADTELPSGYNVTQGPALLVRSRGGGLPHPSVAAVRQRSLVFESYAATFALARSLDLAVQSALDPLRRTSGGGFSDARDETLAQELRDPDTNWPFVLSAYRVTYKDA